MLKMRSIQGINDIYYISLHNFYHLINSITSNYNNNNNLFTYRLHVSTFHYLQRLRCLFSTFF